jgi:hypothetical protein
MAPPSAEHRDQASAERRRVVEPAIWATCPTCWGQRRIWEDPNGEGLVPSVCPGCLGVGERVVTGQ